MTSIAASLAAMGLRAAPATLAQSAPSEPQFDVASIKPADPSSNEKWLRAPADSNTLTLKGQFLVIDRVQRPSDN